MDDHLRGGGGVLLSGEKVLFPPLFFPLSHSCLYSLGQVHIELSQVIEVDDNTATLAIWLPSIKNGRGRKVRLGTSHAWAWIQRKHHHRAGLIMAIAKGRADVLRTRAKASW